MISTKLWRQAFLSKQSKPSNKLNYSTQNLSDKLRETMRSTSQPVSVVSVHIPTTSTSSSSSSSSSSKSSSSITTTTTIELEDNHGATLSSLSSVSLKPPIISFSIRTPSRLATYLTSNSTPLTSKSSTRISLTVNLLSASQREVAQVFSRQKLEKFEYWNPGKISEMWKEEERLLSSSNEPIGHGEGGIQQRLGGGGFPNLAFKSLKEISLARIKCEIVQFIPLRTLANLEEGDEVDSDQEKGSILFLAKVKEIEEGETGKRGYGALVYYEVRSLFLFFFLTSLRTTDSLRHL